jgi:hypothetical protein
MVAAWHLQLTAMLLGLLIMRAIPGFVYCHDSLEKESVMSEFNNFWHTHKNTAEIQCMFKSSLTTASTLHTRSLISQQSPKWYFIGLSGQWRKKGITLAKLSDHSRPQFHLSLLGALALMGTWRHLAAKVATSKDREKQWQTTSKNLPRMQRARAIPVTLLGSGSCQNRPKG